MATSRPLKGGTRKQRAEQRQQQAARTRQVRIAVTAAGTVLVGLLAYFAWPSTKLDLSAQPVIGQASAPHTLVIIGDLKCPACRAFEAATETAVGQAVQNGTVKTAFLHYPFLARTLKLPEDDSLLMARAAECAFQNGNAAAHERLVRGLYRQQGAENTVWGGQGQLTGRLLTAGFDPKTAGQLLECAQNDPAAAAAVTADMRQAERAGIQGTPLVLLDGQRVTSPDALNTTLAGYAVP